MISQDALLAIVETKGPVLPVDIKRETRTDLILTSAMLSNLVSAKKVKLTHLKVGSSPLYYVAGQEKDLVNYIGKLPEKVKRAVERLQAEGVLREIMLSPVERFGLQEAKDYAEALVVTVAGQKEVFWKWYLTTDIETEAKIRAMLSPPVQPAKPVERVAPPKPKVVAPKQVEPMKPRLKVSAPASAEYTAPEKVEVEPKAKPKKKESKVGKVVKAVQKLISPASEDVNADWQDDPFYMELMTFFKGNNITVKEQDCIRKKSEYDFTIILESPVGALTYYCKAKSKKRLNEGDLSTIFLKAQSRKMPILLLTNGVLTKKAEEMLASELQGLTVKKI